MAITVEARNDLLSIVVGMFNAAPGSTILDQLVVAKEAGQSNQQIATNLAQSAEYLSIFPEHLTNDEFATKLVNNLLGDLVTDAGARADAISLLTARIAAQNTSTPAAKAAARAETSLYALNLLKSVPTTDAVFGAAAAAHANKVEVASFYSVDANQNPSSVLDAQEVLENVDDTDASVEAAKQEISDIRTEGETVNLSVAVDTVTGTSFDDTINALSVNPSTGVAGSTLTGFDSIDGGNGIDTLNIYTDGATNGTLPATASVKNVEIVNVYNAAAAGAFGDASKFVGVEQLWQHGAAVAVTNLGAGTTAGFANIATAATFTVNAADAAASASVAVNAVAEASTVAALASATGTLNSVTLSGNVTDTDGKAGVANTNLQVTVGKDVQTLSVNTAVGTTLTVNNGAGTKAVTTVDASASTGAITYAAANTGIHTVKSGAGKDTLTIQTLTSATVNALVNAGDGDNTVTLNTSGTGNATVTTGAGKDTVNVNATNTGKITVNTGAGDDVIVLAGAINSATSIDGGAGADTLQIAGGTLIAQDYILIENGVKNVETLQFTGATVASLDASKLDQFDTFKFAGNAGDKVTGASTAALETAGNLEAVSTGYATTPTKAYGGDLTITQTGTGTIDAFANAVTLAVKSSATAATGNTLTGDVKSASIALTNGVDATKTTDFVASTSVTVGAGENDALTSLTLTGNGTATVNAVGAASKLATIDASGLGGVSAVTATAGDIVGGLTFIGNAAVVETIKLGSGKDNITVASTYDKLDTIEGFDAVKETSNTKSVTDVLVFNGVNLNGAAAGQATKVTLTEFATSLALAFTEAAQASTAATDIMFFNFEGNTYLLADANDNQELDASDLAVKVTGVVDFAADWGVFTA